MTPTLSPAAALAYDVLAACDRLESLRAGTRRGVPYSASYLLDRVEAIIRDLRVSADLCRAAEEDQCHVP